MVREKDCELTHCVWERERETNVTVLSYGERERLWANSLCVRERERQM